jgi:hypothetical protein
MSIPYFPTAADALNELARGLLKDVGFDSDLYGAIYAIPALTDCEASSFTQSCKYVDENGEQKSVGVPYKSYKVTGDRPSIKFVFNMQANAPLYAHFPMDNFGKACDIYVNGRFVCTYDSAQIVYLGDFAKSESVTVELRLYDVGDYNTDYDNIYFSTESKYYFFYSKYDAQMEALEYLSKAAINIEDHSNTMIKGTINLPEGQELILTTIPYDEGWNCYIDGKKVEITRALGSLVAIESTAGEHTIELRYMPKCYVVGFVISGVGIVSFAGIIVYTVIKKRRDEREKEMTSAVETKNPIK